MFIGIQVKVSDIIRSSKCSCIRELEKHTILIHTFISDYEGDKWFWRRFFEMYEYHQYLGLLASSTSFTNDWNHAIQALVPYQYERSHKIPENSSFTTPPVFGSLECKAVRLYDLVPIHLTGSELLTILLPVYELELSFGRNISIPSFTVLLIIRVSACRPFLKLIMLLLYYLLLPLPCVQTNK